MCALKLIFVIYTRKGKDANDCLFFFFHTVMPLTDSTGECGCELACLRIWVNGQTEQKLRRQTSRLM